MSRPHTHRAADCHETVTKSTLFRVEKRARQIYDVSKLPRRKENGERIMALKGLYWKCTNRHGGINRLIAILLGLTALLLVVMVIPTVREQKRSADEIGCVIALDKAQDMISEEYLFNDWNLTKQEASAVADKSRYSRDNLCPGGGDYFIVRDRDTATGFKVVCGLHDPDTQERARLSSGTALNRLSDELERLRKEEKTPPNKLKIKLNGKTLVCELVDSDPRLLFGTSTDIQRKGVVCYYALVGDADARKAVEDKERLDLSGLKEGDVWYFGYADENHASVWKYRKGWSGDAWAET